MRSRGHPSAARGRTAPSSKRERRRQDAEDAERAAREAARGAVVRERRAAAKREANRLEEDRKAASDARALVLRAARLKRENKDARHDDRLAQSEIVRNAVIRRRRATRTHLRAMEGVAQHLEQRARAEELRKQRLDRGFQDRLKNQIIEHEEWVRDVALQDARRAHSRIDEKQAERWEAGARAHENERRQVREGKEAIALRRSEVERQRVECREGGLMEKRVRAEVARLRTNDAIFVKSRGRVRGMWEKRQQQRR